MTFMANGFNRFSRALKELSICAAFLVPFAMVSPSMAQNFAIQPQYDAVGHFHEGLAPAQQGGLWGFVDRTGNWVVKPQYDSVYRGGDGRFGVKRGGQWGYISTSGELVIEPQFAEIRGFSDGVARVRKDDAGWFYIKRNGDRESDETYIEATDRVDGLSVVKIKKEYYDGELWFILDPRGATRETWDLPQQEIESFSPFSEGFATARTKNGTIYMDAKGQLLFNGGAITGGRAFSEGLAAGSNGKKWGFFDKEAKTVINLGLDGARDFSQGVAPAAAGGKWGYIDKAGKTAYPPVFDAAYSFREGYATIKKDGKFGFAQIDDSGKISIFVEPQYEDVFGFQEGLAPAKENGKWGFISAGNADYSLIRGIGELTPN
ncbi:MAG: WG repeat-containing protein [Rhodobiaceae bacterium]|nr:WG repeat-containing protein [Rhodobiaceae bacterium]MCC0049928.1 WG repeat-containing protein [Rhodobiaceae bacterium]